MAKTSTELATAILEHLGVIGTGQSAEAGDLDMVVRAYQAKCAELEAPGLEYLYWELEEIPDAIFLILRDLVTLEVQNAFGQPITAADKDALETIILKRLRRHVGGVATGQPAMSEYF